MRTVRRLLELWALYARMDVLYITRGPLTAVSFYVSDVAVGMATVTATFLLAERFNGLGPWTKQEVLFLLGYALVVRGTSATTTSASSAAASGGGSLTTCSFSHSPCGWCC